MRQSRPWLVLGLILLGIVARLVPHPWNATPVMAIALFGGTYLSKRWSIILPLAIVALSDLLIGWHRTIPFTWGAFALTGMLGWWLRRRLSAARILGGALAGSLLFFLISNFGVWVLERLYPPTAAGLWACYAAGIPFFRATLLGDLVYTVALFGGYAAATALRPAREAAGQTGR
ncbi:MAG: hypothetical protein HYT90_04655 [Candidatus Omnitrophica bacterium]|nr:hypothetical protein [Candidatus Omnitrophota bacterium]